LPKYNFNEAERQAVFNVHGSRCYLCNDLLTMKTVEIDHIIPESLEQQPEQLAKILKSLGCPDDFKVNSFENWMPACRPCNGKKLDLEWRPSLVVQVVLQRAATKAERAREVANTLVSTRRLYNALAVLKKASEEAELPEDVKAELLPLVLFNTETRDKTPEDEPVRVTPSYSVPLYEVLRDDGAIATVRGPYGIGGGPTTTAPVPTHMRCGSCGSPFFSGARCVICGQMDDD